MTGTEVRDILRRLRLNKSEAAAEFGVTTRCMYRWMQIGVSGAGAIALTLADRLEAIGVAWRHNSVNLGIGMSGIVVLSDAQAVAQREIMKRELNGPAT